MIDQIYQIGKDIGERISNVVVMGTGEPLDNYDNLLRFIELLTDENGINISQRNLTVSTCGLVPRMRQLADEKLITLALSLHASNHKREKLSCRLQTAMIYMMWSMHANIILHRQAAESPLSIALGRSERYSRGCSRAFGTRTWHELPYKSDSGKPDKGARLRAVQQGCYRGF